MNEYTAKRLFGFGGVYLFCFFIMSGDAIGILGGTVFHCLKLLCAL
jgi:hypothetical protein